MSALGDPDLDANVSAAIKFQHGILQAQSLTATLFPANETNSTLVGPIGPGDNDAQVLYNATVTGTSSERRVVQDGASRHVLAALLAASLALLLAGWATRPRVDVLPRSPGSIALDIALIAGGNLMSRLPKDSGSQSPEELITALGGPGTCFWLGWGVLPDEEGKAVGGENEGGVSQFGIFVVDEDEGPMEITQRHTA